MFNLFSLSAIMKLPFLFCLPIRRFNSLKKHFGEFKNRVSRSSKYFRFSNPQEITDAISFFRVSSFARRSAISYVSVKRKKFSSLRNQVVFHFALFIFPSKVKPLSALARLLVNLSTFCSAFGSSRQGLK